MARGSEELYRSTQLNGMPYSRDTIDLLKRQTDRNIEQTNAMTADNAASQREVAYNVGNAFAKAPQAYQEGKQRAQQYDINTQGAEEQKGRMQDAQMDREFWNQPDPSGSGTLRSAALMGEFEDKKLNRDTQRQQNRESGIRSDIMVKQFGQTSRQTGLSESASILKDAIKTGDQKQIDAVKKQLSQTYGLKPHEIQLAETQAKGQIASETATGNMVYETSVPGQLANEAVVTIDNKLKGLGALISQADAYKKATWGSKEADLAQTEIENTLLELGQDPKQVSQGLTADTSGVKTRTDKINSAIAKVKSDVKREIAQLKARAGASASPRIQGEIRNLEQNLAQIDQIAGQQKPNIFTGGKGPGNQTMISGALQPNSQGQMNPDGSMNLQLEPTPQMAPVGGPQVQPGMPQQTSKFRQSQKR